ncbi:williams Beuren syndrome chromosome region 22 [Thecamonas trahens ATCC 50062]|uniref:Williams Beuren syndrome chromosome region 22 n=1 Tax=Thecamonas trahens ATCC 50062 TaxID=461836 RepID=A0A0L0DMM1_THETB|nr:williams Beuren syndrome chromosome region 22 [Thecamonas trahens ATCC 50062]KNC53520.1 williams Beuren syndrome chromosome region 22 [Thecamonas trahens ATCC 50062]|eukprot:XP_013761841.1 williams Beuren syndrome chromosome region 22 [Thecamonas trahens ATCC 50062]
MSSRPEHVNPPEIFYGEDEAAKYRKSSRMIAVQAQMSQRAIELLMLPQGEPALLLDIGAGTGLSGSELTEEGHTWIGVDISRAMLEQAVDRGVEGDLAEADIGHGLFFRPGTFDGAISVSVLQWLCHIYKNEHVPKRRLRKFFQSLFNCLSPGARAVFQFYPETPAQIELIVAAAMECGFSGGLVVDYPNSKKAKKYFLCLSAGVSAYKPEALGTGPRNAGEGVKYTEMKRREARTKKRRGIKGTREWIDRKKTSQRNRGLEVRRDSKYTGRRRRRAFG